MNKENIKIIAEKKKKKPNQPITGVTKPYPTQKKAKGTSNWSSASLPFTRYSTRGLAWDRPFDSQKSIKNIQMFFLNK